jgi:hypothetical protein
MSEQLYKFEPRCKCGHGLYSHYLCGGPETRCLHGGCECEAFREGKRNQSRTLDAGTETGA